MMHQESWVGMMMLAETSRNELLRESYHRRLVNCCKKKKSFINKVTIPEMEFMGAVSKVAKAIGL